MISVCPNVSESRSENSPHELIGDRGPSIAMDRPLFGVHEVGLKTMPLLQIRATVPDTRAWGESAHSLPLRRADGGDRRELLGVEFAVRCRRVGARLLGALHARDGAGHGGMG